MEAGFNRNTWAAAMDMSYPGIDMIDTGKVTPRLPTLMRMQELIGKYTLDELVYGRHPPKLRRTEAELSDAGVKALLLELGTSPDATEALGVHVASPAGRFVRCTRSYVIAFVERYRLARAEGAERATAIDVAKTAAANAQANVDGVAERVKPATAPQLEALGQQVKASAAERTGVVTPPRKRRRRA
jgi:hypothetical protein